MAAAIILFPFKLVAKVLGYVSAAVINTFTWILGVGGLIIGKITSFLGGGFIIISTIMLVTGNTEVKQAISYYLISIAGILIAPLIKTLTRGLFGLR